jgi:hypothetical protein
MIWVDDLGSSVSIRGSRYRTCIPKVRFGRVGLVVTKCPKLQVVERIIEYG